MNVKRITRLLKLIQTLQSGSGLNADGLAAECCVSRRTVFRDLDALREAGVPLHYDPALDRYSIDGQYYLRPLNLTLDEAASLVVLSGEMGRSDRLPFYEPALAGALKLERTLSPALRQQLRSIASGICIQPCPVSNMQSKHDIYQKLVDARAQRRVVRIEYEGIGEDSPGWITLRPYFLLFRGHSWYVIGHSSLHRAVQTFNLSRIVTVQVLTKNFGFPKGYKIERYLRNAWAIAPQEGPDQQVEIRFDPLIARSVAEVTWHKTQETLFEDDGTLVYRATVSGLNEIVWWVLMYGELAEVRKPKALRHLVLERARKMLRKYGDN